MVQVTDKIPQICLNELNNVRNFVNDIIKKYGSLAKWGMPVFTNELQIACVLWVNDRTGLGLQQIAKMVGLDQTTLYKLKQKIEQKGMFNIYDPNTRSMVTIQKSYYDLLQLVEEKLQPKAKAMITDLLESAIIREFLSKEIPKRRKTKGHKSTLSPKDKQNTIRVVRRLIEYFAQNSMTTNPDTWQEGDVEKALFEIYKGDYSKIRIAMKFLRQVPQWGNWFSGKIGAETSYAKPIPRHITYEHYLRSRELWKEGKLSDAEFLVIWLHLTTGAREGWKTVTQTESTPLEDAVSSLVGLKWEKLYRVGDTWILEIYESKTAKYWTCDLSWLDAEPIEALLKYRKERGSIIASITGFKTVFEFRKFYEKVLAKVSKLLNLGFELTAHDIRRSHLAILAEFGVPLEVACGGLMDLGVGWEDLKTAYVFYLRYSKYAKQKVMETIQSRKKEIEVLVSSSK
jgi:DNA-binding MarR family transcriptional regulator